MLRLMTSAVAAFVLASAARADVSPKEIRQAAAEIDARLDAHGKAAKVPPGEPITDEVFVRRIYLDLAGRIPTTAEGSAFLGSSRTDKRAELIRDLLGRESYVSHFYHFWADVLRIKSSFTNTANVVPVAYIAYLKESLRSNKPYDRFVFEMLSAKGMAWDNGAIGYYLRDPAMPLDNMALTSRVFLGTRIECAQCHDHPFDKWKQTEFYHLAAYTYGNRGISEAYDGARDAIKARQQAIEDDFKREKAASKDGGKAAAERKIQRLEAMQYRKAVGIIKSPVGQLLSPVGLDRKRDAVLKLPTDFHQDNGKPGDVTAPAPLFGTAPPLSPGDDPAEAFARWVTSPDNPRFTRVIVNRLWKKLFGVALTEPLDDLRDDSVAMVPEVEAYLVKLMVELRYDMRAFLAVVANTRAYQSSAARTEYNRDEAYHFRGPVLRRMTAEQAWDSLVALASYEPDARDLAREAREARKVAVSHMVYDAYTNFDGTKLVDMVYAILMAENERDARMRVVQEAQIVAKRNKDAAKELELNRRASAIRREHGEAMAREFITPLLENLARLKNGPDARPAVDETYVMNTNPAVFGSETWKRMYVSGYGPPPKTHDQLAAAKKAEDIRLAALAAKVGVPEKDRDAFAAYYRKAAAEWRRASEMDSPAPRGHFLRTMGQSDRDFVENANPVPSIPQALALTNGELLTRTGLMSPHSPLMRAVRSGDPADAAYMALLSRKPTGRERAAWQKAVAAGATGEDLVHALLSTKQFIFIQ